MGPVLSDAPSTRDSHPRMGQAGEGVGPRVQSFELLRYQPNNLPVDGRPVVDQIGDLEAMYPPPKDLDAWVQDRTDGQGCQGKLDAGKDIGYVPMLGSMFTRSGLTLVCSTSWAESACWAVSQQCFGCTFVRVFVEVVLKGHHKGNHISYVVAGERFHLYRSKGQLRCVRASQAWPSRIPKLGMAPRLVPHDARTAKVSRARKKKAAKVAAVCSRARSCESRLHNSHKWV